MKFTEQLFSEKSGNNPKTKWQKKIEPVLLTPNNSPGDIISNETDRKSLYQLLKILRVEHGRKDMFSRQTTLELFGAMLVIIARNINKKNKVITTFQSIEE